MIPLKNYIEKTNKEEKNSLKRNLCQYCKAPTSPKRYALLAK
jgi:hypothetical protein